VLEIPQVTIDDVAELAAVAKASYVDHYLHLWHDGGEWYLNRSFSIEQLASELESDANRFYIARWGGEDVGFMKTRTDRTLPMFRAEDAFEVERIYLTAAAQGKGIGRALIELAVRDAREMGRNVVWLKAMDTSDDAVAFYEKVGFEKCGGERLDFEMLKDELRGMFWMKREI
jgi:ribosomal protein S18 acetylase RimI-like enzyme